MPLKNPFIGSTPPPPGTLKVSSGGDNPEEVQRSIFELVKRLTDRLAPTTVWYPITFDSLVAGANTGVLKLSDTYNGILNCLTDGVVNVYFGSMPTKIPDMQLQGTPNPILIPFPARQDQQILLEVDSASPVAAVGVVHLVQY